MAAQEAAARHIAIDHGAAPNAHAWLNEHGVFAVIDGVQMQLFGPAVSAPFVALTQAVRAAFREAPK